MIILVDRGFDIVVASDVAAECDVTSVVQEWIRLRRALQYRDWCNSHCGVNRRIGACLAVEVPKQCVFFHIGKYPHDPTNMFPLRLTADRPNRIRNSGRK